MLAPSIHSVIFNLLVRLQSVSGQNQSDNVLRQQTKSIQFEYLVRVRVNKFEDLIYFEKKSFRFVSWNSFFKEFTSLSLVVFYSPFEQLILCTCTGYIFLQLIISYKLFLFKKMIILVSYCNYQVSRIALSIKQLTSVDCYAAGNESQTSFPQLLQTIIIGGVQEACSKSNKSY